MTLPARAKRSIVQTGRFFTDFANAMALWKLWSFLALNDLRARFARTMLSYGWVLATFAIWAAGVGFVYARLFDLDVKEFAPFLTIGFAVWGFIVASFTDSSTAFVGAAGYIKQFNLPKQVYVFRSVFSQSVSFALTLIVCVVVVTACGKFTVAGLLIGLVGVIVVLAAGLAHAFLSAYLTPYVRDFPHAIGSLLSVLFFLTPIIFPAELLARRGLDMIYRYNPFYYLLEMVRAPLLTGRWPEPSIVLGALAYLVVIWAIVFAVCKPLDRKLAYAL